MSRFEIEILPENAISVEFKCSKCKEWTSNELDTDFQNESFPYSSSNILYCTECEKPYEYSIKVDYDKLEISFREKNLFGSLKHSSVVKLDDYNTSSPHKSKEFYYLQIDRLKKILSISTEEYIVDQSLNRLVYSGVITSLETYLSEIYLLTVFYSEETTQKFVREYEPYKKEKLSFHEIYTIYNGIEPKIREDLENFIYHNVPKLISIFNIYDFKLEKYSKIDEIAKSIKKRHNLVHRSGLDKNDNFQEVSKEEVESVMKNFNSFVDYIHKKFEERCFEPDFWLGLPF